MRWLEASQGGRQRCRRGERRSREAIGGVYNGGTGAVTKVLDVAQTLAKELQVPVQTDVVGQYRAGDVRHCFADISRIRKELGYEPQVRLEDGIRDLLTWLRTQSADDRIDAARQELERRGLAR